MIKEDIRDQNDIALIFDIIASTSCSSKLELRPMSENMRSGYKFSSCIANLDKHTFSKQKNKIIDERTGP